jgi:hypothetical protein
MTTTTTWSGRGMRPGCGRDAVVVGSAGGGPALAEVAGVAEGLALDVEAAGSLLTARGLDDEQAVSAVATRHPASTPVPQGSRRTDTSSRVCTSIARGRKHAVGPPATSVSPAEGGSPDGEPTGAVRVP